MIYLIGGPPKCGKTTLAKQFSIQNQIPWISTDTLECVIRPYMTPEQILERFPVRVQRGETNDEKYTKFTTKEIIQAYQKQSEVVYDAVDMYINCELTDGHGIIIEGYHITPELAFRFQQKYPDQIRVIFVIKINQEKFLETILKSTTSNDWIIRRTRNPDTFLLIARMICEYGQLFLEEAQRYGFEVVNMDDDFEEKIQHGISTLLLNF